MIAIFADPAGRISSQVDVKSHGGVVETIDGDGPRGTRIAPW